MRILFYYPSNKRSNVLETTFQELRNEGHEVIFLSTCAKGDLHLKFEEMGIPTYSNVIKNSPLLYYFRQFIFLIKFCKKHKIDFVFSHLQHVNFIAVFAQYFIKAEVIIFRHHFKFNKGNFGIPLKVNKNEVLFDKIINTFAKRIIVPSRGVYEGMTSYENIDSSKLDVIPYLYNFKHYGSPDQNEVDRLKAKYSAKLRVIMIARLIPFKRHILIFPVFKKLIDEGMDIQVLVLDEGPEKDKLQAYISSHELEDRIHLLGFKTNVIDYMGASDVIIHPSITEASNNTIKEIGLQEKVVAVCSGVGDFDDYIVNEENGFLMNIEQPEVDSEKIIRKIYNKKELISTIGAKLKQTIRQQFGNYDEIKKKHLDLIHKKSN